jgi:uncharacterized protein (DUF1501 family)
MKRRRFLQVGLAGAGSLMIPWPARAALQASAPEPHFFLQVILAGGADTSYMFDARPLAMTQAGKLQNYLGKEPTPWTGSNGGSCLATSFVNPLLPFKNRFSVINGVVMAPDFDGHDQNMNLLLTGSNFGGDSFVPHLNLAETGISPLVIDAVVNGFPIATLTNQADSIPLTPSAVAHLRAKVNALPALDGDLNSFILSRLTANAAGPGRFNAAAALFLDGMNRGPDLQGRISQIRQPVSNDAPEKQFAAMISDFFRQSLARSAVWTISDSFDTHAASLAKNQPALFQRTFSQIANVLQVLSTTPFDDKRSILDVTTFMITSEFSRTMRIDGYAIDNTGTNHNCFANTVLIGGKGVKGGMVIGATDYQSPTDKVSGAHLAMDPTILKLMGRPFDVKSLQSRSDQPGAFSMTDYLSIASVVNTIYKLFSNPASRYRMIDRGLPVAPTLDGLLS